MSQQKGGAAWRGSSLIFFVQFTTKGVEQVQAALGQVQEKLTAVQKGVDAVGKAGTYAFATVSASAIGFVRSGLNASSMGEQLTLQMQRLSLAIGGVFRPELEKVIELVRSAADWFSNLSAAQAESIARWAKAAVVATGTAMILPRIIAGVQLLIVGIRGLAGAISLALSSTGIGALLPILGAVLSLFTAAGMGATAFEKGLSGVWEVLKPLVDAVKELWTEIAKLIAPFKDLFIGVAKVAIAILTGLVKVLTFIVSMIAKLIDGIKWLFGIKDKPAETAAAASEGRRGPLAPKVGGPEDITAAFSRMNTAALNATAGALGKDHAERTADAVEEMRDDQKAVRRLMEDGRANVR